MTPNEEVKTIHASLNDGSLRKWEFEPYTEQGKIELTDQDYATIQRIKGNTLKWNQLVANNRDGTTLNGITFTRNGNSWSASGTSTALATVSLNANNTPIKLMNGHKYFLKGCPSGGSNTKYYYGLSGIPIDFGNGGIYTSTFADNTDAYPRFDVVAGQTVNFTNMSFICVDLTAMGIDNLTTVQEVEKWLSNNIGLLPYYDYTLGSLISFNGIELKSTGKNLLSFPYASGSSSTITVNNDGSLSINKTSSSDIYFNFYTSNNGLKLPSGNYIIKNHNAFPNNVGIYCIVRLNGITVSSTVLSGNNLQRTINIPDGAILICYMQLAPAFTGQTEIKLTLSVEDLNAFEPYTSSTLSLPISTYFPDGMKSAGSVYDELTQSKAITRIGSRAYQSGDEDDASVITDGTTTYYALTTPTEVDISLDLTYPIWNGGTEQILPINGSTPTTSSMKATIEYPDRTEDVNFLYKQTSFESAIPQFSLVCKNQELPMTLEDNKLICECDSSITNESGFFDCKVKMQDLDSVAYSQKIQLHVERGIND